MTSSICCTICSDIYIIFAGDAKFYKHVMLLKL